MPRTSRGSREIRGERVDLFGRERRLRAEQCMIHADGHRRDAFHRELQVLYGRHSAITALTLFERGANCHPNWYDHIEVLGEVVPLREADGAHEWIVDLDEERAPELTGAAEQRVVGVGLVLDVALADDPL